MESPLHCAARVDSPDMLVRWPLRLCALLCLRMLSHNMCVISHARHQDLLFKWGANLRVVNVRRQLPVDVALEQHIVAVLDKEAFRQVCCELVPCNVCVRRR
jgi:hypothetical protein